MGPEEVAINCTMFIWSSIENDKVFIISYYDYDMVVPFHEKNDGCTILLCARPYAITLVHLLSVHKVFSYMHLLRRLLQLCFRLGKKQEMHGYTSACDKDTLGPARE